MCGKSTAVKAEDKEFTSFKVGDRVEFTTTHGDITAGLYIGLRGTIVGHDGYIPDPLYTVKLDTGRTAHVFGSRFKWVNEPAPSVPKKTPQFKPGDKVRVVRKVEKEDGWRNVWTNRMDEFIGSRQTVERFDPLGVSFEESLYAFPPSSLELVVETPKAPQKTPRRASAVKTEDGVDLHLSHTEAEVLYRILHRVGGEYSRSPRKYADRMHSALYKAGVQLDVDHYKLEGSLQFVNYPTEKVPKDTRKLSVGDVAEVATNYYSTIRKGEKVKLVKVLKEEAERTFYRAVPVKRTSRHISDYSFWSDQLKLVA